MSNRNSSSPTCGWCTWCAPPPGWPRTSWRAHNRRNSSLFTDNSPGASIYHATKWGVEGFAEALAGEVAPLGIGVTIVEPGAANTDFGKGGLRFGAPLDAYDTSPAAAVRGFSNGVPTHLLVGDPARIAAAMIDSVDQEPAPLRLVLGSDSWTAITTALESRLAAVRPQKDIASATDYRRPGMA